MRLLTTGIFVALLTLLATTPSAASGNLRQRADDAAMTSQWNRTFAYMKRLDARDTSRGGGFGFAPTLLASQRAWLSFRDKQCVIEGGEFAGGTLQSATQTRCLIRITQDRTAQLKKLVWKR